MSGAGGSGLPAAVIRPRQVVMVTAENVAEALPALVRGVGLGSEPVRAVAVEFDRLPDVGRQVDHALEGLARVALSLWPNWHADGSSGGEAEPSARWVEAARRLCRAGRNPLPKGFPPATHARQLGLAIEPGGLTLVLCLNDASADPARLLGFSRAAEWLARESGAAVVALVPAALSRAPELEGISSGAVQWAPDVAPADPAVPDEETHRVWPVRGRPHPYSPGEQLLARRLGQDQELAPLFAFNQRVRTRLGSDFLVDLLHEGARLVVEVDGYEHHLNRYAFSLDRRRDYELVLSGYLVLRLPHDEVMADAELAVEKIRDLVRFRAGPFPTTQVKPT